ncbi:hypothetical protein YC2023_046426 [Brassica napus]
MWECREVSTPLGSQFKLQAVSKDNELEEAKAMERIPYSSAVGSLMYAMVGSRPDLAYAVGMVCRYMSKPGREHWLATKWIMRYVKGALRLNLTFKKSKDFKVRGYCDSDYGTDRDRSRSITGYVYTVGGNTVSWRSSLQKVVALSTTEAEYMALSDAIREGICDGEKVSRKSEETERWDISRKIEEVQSSSRMQWFQTIEREFDSKVEIVRLVEIELEVSPGPRPIRETPKEETEALTGHGDLMIRPGSTEL